MEKKNMKKYLNAKIYKLASLNLSKKFQKPEQVAIDKLVEKFDENEPTFKDSEQTREFLLKHHKSVVYPKKHKKVKRFSLFMVYVVIISILIIIRYFDRFFS